MTAEPSAFTQEEWLHMVGPVLLGALIGFTVVFLICSLIKGRDHDA